ncbi:MAG: peptidylprolyl isomerase [Dehalococcoidia bacterium]|nr:peptidylprolyl isomerase [Dehalococcoidia bacterium]
MAKKKVEKPKREVTKRQLSRWQQQKKRQRIILGSGIAVIVIVLGIVGAGVYNKWYIAEYKPLHETVIEVNETKFDMDYYVKMLKYYGEGVSTQYMPLVADEVVSIIGRNELIKQEAMELGISVSNDEVNQSLKNYDPPLSKDYEDVVRTEILVNKLLDEYFELEVPRFAEQRHILAMFLESDSQVNEVSARLEAGEDFAELAGELSLDAICKAQKGDLGWRPEGILTMLLESSILDEHAFGCELGVLSQPIYDETKIKTVGYWLLEVLDRDEAAAEAHVRVILLASEREANDVRTRLDAGEGFATLAKEFSQHDGSRESGGEFVVSSSDTVSETLTEFALNSELGVLSQPIRDDAVYTKGGYWLLKVVAVDDNRQIEKENRDLLKGDALNKWVEELRDDPENKVVTYLDDEKKQWAIWHLFIAS